MKRKVAERRVEWRLEREDWTVKHGVRGVEIKVECGIWRVERRVWRVVWRVERKVEWK